ncbi:CMRF35-like molecule 6 [Bubalus kerabau]|uniref:CMRF35-like molecule 6 n=1 Tax=Bubalus carabanensis TaxID=3119969 RepID=UPI00244EFF4F|nr:CMRF35-like molecule 6 [Bubalus carabanensis]
MTPRGRAGWLPSALLLLQLPGCLSLSGPRRVRGIVGGSLRVECRYREEFINNTKYWCKHPCVLLRKTVETTESEREVRRGRLSIRDHPARLTFTVTLENLREEDGGLYRCGIDVLSTFDPIFDVEVSVIPGPHRDRVWDPGKETGPAFCFAHTPATATGPERSTGSPGSPTSLPVPTWSTASGQETPDPVQAPRPLLGSAHFLLLVFLKVPLLLGMLGAVLWFHRPLRSSADRRRQSIYRNQ